MNKFNLQNYLPVLVIIFFLLILVGGGLLIWPKSQESATLKNDIKAKQSEIEQTKNYFKQLGELKIKLETDYLDELSKIGAALPSDSSVAMPSFLKFLQETASQSGLILKSVSPSSDVSAAGENIKELKVEFSVDGSYSAFKNFLSALENSSRLIETESISFSLAPPPKPGEVLPPGAQPGPSLSSFSLQIKTFSY